MNNAQADVDNVIQVYLDCYPQYYQSWDDECEEEAIEETDVELDVESSEASDDSAIINAFLTGFELQREELAAARAQEKQRRLHKLLGAVRRKDDGASVDTIVTPEGVTVAVEKASSESSIHPCLKDIDISDSQMKLSNLASTYPIPNDPGLSPAFSVLVTKASFEEGGVYNFIDHLKFKGLKPVPTIAKMLDTDRIDLRYYGIDPRIIEIICYAIRNNASITTIDLTDNWLTTSACYHLGDLLHKNTLTTLILSRCRIGADGVAGLRDGLAVNSSLITLDLDACDLEDVGLEVVSTALRENETLEELRLSNNNLNVASTEYLRHLIIFSKSIKWLDLSWNSLFDEEIWRALVKPILNNYILVGLNVAWNGIGSECLKYFSAIFRKSQLEVLDLRSNNLSKFDAMVLSKALAKNDVLEELYLGSNPIGREGAFALISSLTMENAPESKLRLLNLENVWPDKDVIPELEKIENEKPWLRIELGGILSDYPLLGPDVMRIVLRRARYEAMAQKNKKRRRNFGHFVLTLTDKPVRRGRFKMLIHEFRLRLSKSLVDEIIAAFPGPRKTVDTGLLKAIYLEEFPDTKPPPEKPSKKKDKVEIEEEVKVLERPKSKLKVRSRAKLRVKKVRAEEWAEEEDGYWFDDMQDY